MSDQNRTVLPLSAAVPDMEDMTKGVPMIFSLTDCDALEAYCADRDDTRYKYTSSQAGQVLADASALGLICSAKEVRNLVETGSRYRRPTEQSLDTPLEKRIIGLIDDYENTPSLAEMIAKVVREHDAEQPKDATCPNCGSIA